MESITNAIKETPVPTLLILGGLIFLFLGFVTKIGGIIEVSPEQKRWAIPVGFLVLTIGLVLNFAPTSPPTVSKTGTPSPPSTVSETGTPSPPSTVSEQTYLSELDELIRKWDVETTRSNLQYLSESQDSCISQFARRLDIELEKNGSEGFRTVNPIKRELNEQYNCNLAIIPYAFSP